MKPLPSSLRVAIGFLAAIWTVGLIALLVGAPGELVFAAGAIGTVAALVEITTHRARPAVAPVSDDLATETEAPPNMQPEQIKPSNSLHI